MTKGNKAALTVLIILVIADVLGYFYYMNLPLTRINKQLALGNKYLNSQDYENAIMAFDKVLVIEPKNGPAIDGLVESYQEIGSALEQEGNLEEEYRRLQEGYEKTNDESLNDLFLAPAESVKARLKKDVSEENADDLLELLSSDEYAAYLKRLSISGDSGEDKEKIFSDLAAVMDSNGELGKEYEVLQKLFPDDPDILERYYRPDADFLKKLEELCRQKDYDGVRSAIASGEAADLRKRLAITEHSDIPQDGDEGLAVYHIGVYYGVYYGGITGGRREGGSGLWIVCKENGSLNYYADGPWSNDKPNGQTVVTQVSPFDGKPCQFVYTGNIINGLWDGAVDRADNMEDGRKLEWIINFHNGKVVVLRTGNDGRNVVSEAPIVDTYSGKMGDLAFTEPDKYYGIEGFEK